MFDDAPTPKRWPTTCCGTLNQSLPRKFEIALPDAGRIAPPHPFMTFWFVSGEARADGTIGLNGWWLVGVWLDASHGAQLREFTPMD